MTSARDPFTRYRERLADLGFRPSSTRGQNFLLDPTLHRWIAAAAAPTAADLVLEVGVGLGFLTGELAALAGRVVGVEIDERLFEVATADLRGRANVDLVLADALGGPGGTLPDAVRAALAAAMPAPPGAFLVVANLPYAASGPLLAELGCLERPPDRIVVLVQKELGERLAASAATPAYGGLSVQLQVGYAVELLRTVPPEVFRPRPKVASAVVRLVRRQPGRGWSVGERRRFQVFVRALFGQRRKALRTTLGQALAALDPELPAGGLARLELPEDLLALRAEAIGPDALADLFERVAGG
ncbi:MAG: 16S rRNA (adenine(1518)-N(6)/adenine(1519)-N(6))-dimethyltransferase RsmA [Planctomycetota bacterium]